MECPELRYFDFDPVQRAKERRPQLVVACLTILRAFKLHGKPSGKPALGSFEQWSALVRDALWWIGMEDPTASMEKVREGDPELSSLKAVSTRWGAVLGDAKVTAGDLVDAALGNLALNDALYAVAGEKGQINRAKLGLWLKKKIGRIVDGKKIQRIGERSGAALWQLEG